MEGGQGEELLKDEQGHNQKVLFNSGGRESQFRTWGKNPQAEARRYKLPQSSALAPNRFSKW